MFKVEKPLIGTKRVHRDTSILNPGIDPRKEVETIVKRKKSQRVQNKRKF